MGTLPWEWVQRKIPFTKYLILRTDRCCDGSQKTVLLAAELERELITAHLLLVLSSAQTCKLRELDIVPVQQRNQYPELTGQVSRAISRFTLLTLLHLNSLEVEADTLQVSTQCIVCL